MIIPIAFPSSAEFWLNSCKNIKMSACTLKGRKLISLPQDFKLQINEDVATKCARLCGLKTPLHVFTDAVSHRNRALNCICHVIPKNLLGSSFIKLEFIGKNPLPDDIQIYMSCPEFTFLQASSRLSPLLRRAGLIDAASAGPRKKPTRAA